MKIYKIIPVGLAILILAGCKHSSNSKAFLPSVNGEANSVVVVMAGSNWKSGPGDTLRKVLTQPVYGLPQDEPTFDLIFVPHSSFDKVYQSQRNIIVTFIGADYKNKIIVQKDNWAKPQLVLTITAPNTTEFEKLVKEKSTEIIALINEMEISRLMSDYKHSLNKKLFEKVYKKHQIKIYAPVGYTINTDTNNFLWLGNEYRDIVEGIFIYWYPFTDTSTFTRKYLITKRNYLLKAYVPGEVEGSYMTTESRYPVQMKTFNLKDNRYTVELRGLWKVHNGVAMGGPFVSITQYDKKHNRIITAEGFVFAPGHKKRNLLRRVEAIVYSLDY